MIYLIRVVDEYKSEQIISKYLNTVESKKFTIKNLLENKQYPCYVKIISPLAVHKVKSGAIFRIESTNMLKQQIKAISARFKALKAKSIVVQPEINGEEFILGLRNDKKFGYLIMLGIGGKHAEELKDVVFRKTPILKKDAIEMISELKNQVIVLNINKSLLINAMLKIQNIIKDYKVDTLDINPIKITNKKAIVVDARLYLG